MLVLTAAGLVLSTSIPDALDERGLVFATAFVAMHHGRNLFVLWCVGDRDPASFRSFLRIEIWLAMSGVCWIAGGLAHGPARIALWVLALFLELGSPWWRYWTPGLGSSSLADWRVSAHHFAERCGLFVIIALGESVLVTGATFGEIVDWTPPVVAAFAVALSGSIAMWWVYFATTADEAAEEMARSADPGRLARNAYTYSHLPMVAGIIMAAAGDELVLAHPTGHAAVAAVSTVVGGPALFLVGSAMFNRMMCGVWPVSHLLGLVVVAGTSGLAPIASPLALSAATTIVLAGVGVWETLASGIRSAHE